MWVCLSLKTHTWNPRSLSAKHRGEKNQFSPRNATLICIWLSPSISSFQPARQINIVKWGVERQQQRCHIPPLPNTSHSALPLSLALQTWGGRRGRRRKPKPLLFPPLPSPDQEHTWAVLLTKGHLQRDEGNVATRAKRGRTERKGSRDGGSLMVHALLLPPSRQDHLVTKEARGDKEKEMVQKSTLL